MLAAYREELTRGIAELNAVIGELAAWRAQRPTAASLPRYSAAQLSKREDGLRRNRGRVTFGGALTHSPCALPPRLSELALY
jgi:hypothetical protein